MKILEYTINHYEDVLKLMEKTPGVTIREADSREATARYLARNPSLSFLAVEDGKIIGVAMCGHDGRRGYKQHYDELLVDGILRTPACFADIYTALLAEIPSFFEQRGFATLALMSCEGVIGRIEESVNDLTGDVWHQWLELNYSMSRQPSILGSADHILYIGRKI